MPAETVPAAAIDLEDLRATVETLAAMDRTACSPGEAEAATWLRERLERAGARAVIEPAEASPGYAKPIASLTALGALGGAAVLAGRRRTGAAIAAAAGALLADDVSNGLRPWRHRIAPPQPTTNVVAGVGEEDAPRTVVVLAHHDAAPTGLVFDQSAQHWAAERFPGILERIDTSLPLWWPVLAGPGLAALGGLRRRRGLAIAGTALSAVATAAFADIARSPTVPGANDNLSAVAVLVALAEVLRERPAEGVRVLLVSCGAEEVLQGGIHGFARRWFGRLDRQSTFFLNLDTVGSPRLILLEGEGPVVMEDYHRREFRDLVDRCAARAGIGLRRGMRARASTDAVIPSRARFPTVTIASMDDAKALANYHQMSDTPENLDYESVARATALSDEVIRALGRGEPA